MTRLGRIEAVNALYKSLNPLWGQHRGPLEEMQYYELAALESEILNTVPYETLTAFVGGPEAIAMMDVLAQTEHRMTLALADDNLQTRTVNHRTVQDVIDEMKRIVA